MEITTKQIKQEVEKIIPEIIRIRQHLHAHPELSLAEFRTSEFIRSQLKSLDVDILPPFLKTDVIAILNADNGGKNVTLRADIDALPIQEQSNQIYCSKNNEMMHACGHDGHTAMLLGAAMILTNFKELVDGSVRFVFQPGEEIVAAGRDLVASGALEEPKPSAVLAMHGWPGYPVGAICSKSGNFMAAADFFKIKIVGKGGHGASPEKTIDPLLTASKIINSLYLIPTRKFNALDSVVISIGKIMGGSNANVIPDFVTMEGSVRYFGKEVGEKIPEYFENVIRSECNYSGAQYDLNYERPYIPTVNDERVVLQCREYVKDFIGEQSWVNVKNPVMSSEDFSYYIENNPGAMFFLGLGEGWPDLHTDSFDFNDKALKNGILFLVVSTLGLLKKNNRV